MSCPRTNRTALLACAALLAVTAQLAACSHADPPVPTAEPPQAAPEPVPPSSSAAPSPIAPPIAAAPPAPPVPLPVLAREVHEHDNNLFVTGMDGRTAQLTSTGLDTQPVLSPERRRVLFLRRLPGEPYRRDLYLARLDGSPPEILVHDDPARSVLGDGEYPWVTGITAPAFFPDGKRAAFSVEDGRGEAILGVDLATKRAGWINSAFGWGHIIVPRGPFAGDLVLYKHRYHVDEDGTYDQCWLVDGRTGKWKINLTAVDRECDDSPAMRARLRY